MEDNENIEYNLNKTSKRKDVTENIYDEINETETNIRKLTDSRKVSALTNSKSTLNIKHPPLCLQDGVDKRKTQKATHTEMCICEICTCGSVYAYRRHTSIIFIKSKTPFTHSKFTL